MLWLIAFYPYSFMLASDAIFAYPFGQNDNSIIIISRPHVSGECVRVCMCMWVWSSLWKNENKLRVLRYSPWHDRALLWHAWVLRVSYATRVPPYLYASSLPYPQPIVWPVCIASSANCRCIYSDQLGAGKVRIGKWDSPLRRLWRKGPVTCVSSSPDLTISHVWFDVQCKLVQADVHTDLMPLFLLAVGFALASFIYGNRFFGAQKCQFWSLNSFLTRVLQLQIDRWRSIQRDSH